MAISTESLSLYGESDKSMCDCVKYEAKGSTGLKHLVHLDRIYKVRLVD